MKSFSQYPITLLLISFICTSCGGGASSGSNDNPQNDSTGSVSLEQAWITDTMLTPESALWIPGADFFYVSEVKGKTGDKEASGAVARIDAHGKILDLHWADGLNGPKGLGIYEDTLFVADLKQLVLIDTATGKILQRITAPGATFLNDIAVDKAGTVYVSDTRQGKIYRYQKGKMAPFLESPEVKGANGLIIRKNKLWILTSGGIYTCEMDGKNMKLFSDAVKDGDGITFVNDTTLIASRWAGEIYYVHANGDADLLLDTKKKGSNTADLDYVPDLQLLVVPNFNGNTVTAYTIKHQ